MRQLKGKVKETRKEKKQRKVENMENQRKITSVVIPTLGVVFLLLVLYVYLKTRPIAEL